ncbi:3-isopropylmalate dehydratase small subunit [Streptococcus pneumoniae]|nr:3-isopropylmalate dehydratase small subunit [Streptococcus pneumoniae]
MGLFFYNKIGSIISIVDLPTTNIIEPNELNNGLLPIVQPREVREKLAQLQPTDQVTVDLEQQKIISPVEEFTFEIDSEWKHKLLNSLDDIGITLQYEELIAAYEKQRPAYWQD